MSEIGGSGTARVDALRVIVALVESAVAAASTFAASTEDNPGPCDQTWCPFCAIAAGVAGEHHPLMSVVADHGAAVLAVLHTMVTDGESAATTAETPADGTQPGRYQHIPVTVHD